MNTEKHTRKNRIDKALQLAGWNVNNPAQVITEFNIRLEIAEPASAYVTHQFSDYVLLGKNGKPLAVIEAKSSSKDAALGREQAKQYCYHIKDTKGGELPFCFYTNGLEIYFNDLEHNAPRKTVGFPTLDDLERFRHIRDNKKPLSHQRINTDIVERDYQIQAIRTVLEGIEQKRRDFLLVMATGTGKTRTCIALVDVLMRARHVENVLFLVDRVPLREQALAAFKEYLPHEPRWSSDEPFAKDRRIYVSTCQTMLNIIRNTADYLSPHFFDLLVIDESHRSIYNTYGEILDYFKVIHVGLTATPTDVIDHNTFRLFQCENELPTFAYTYEQAVNHQPPYLCAFQVMKIQTQFQKDGISKRTISLEDQKQLMLDGKEIAEINFEGTQLEKQVTNKGTNTLIVKEFMEESVKDSNGVLPAKTIFFCVSIAHARRIETIFDDLYPQYCGELAKVMVSEDPRVYGKGGLLDQFTNNDMPRIAISVDMLDTGIDVREIVNLVFAKPVYSYTKFWQMIGRGTRLLEKQKIKPWCVEKDMFLILDCWDNFEYFKLQPQGKQLKTAVPLPVRLVGIRLDKIETALELGKTQIADKEITALRGQIAELPQNSVVIIEAAPLLHSLSEADFWTTLNADKIQFLRQHIKPLFRTVSQVDFKAMRFSKDVLEISVLLLRDEDTRQFDALKDALIETIRQLPLAVPMVKREANIIQHAQQKHYWANCTDSALDELARKLSPLMKFCEQQTPNALVELDLHDELHSKEQIEFSPQHQAVSISRYREMVESLINALSDSHPILQKIKHGQIVSDVEIDDLAKQLNAAYPHITEPLLQRIYQNRHAHFLQLLRHILGVETLSRFPDTVSHAFDSFIATHSNLNSQQLEFLRLLKNVIIERETIEKRDLIQSPFTVIHPQGIRGVFSPSEINEILELTQRLAA